MNSRPYDVTLQNLLINIIVNNKHLFANYCDRKIIYSKEFLYSQHLKLCFLHTCISSRKRNIILEVIWHSSIRTPSRALSNLFLTVLRCFFRSIDLISEYVYHDLDRVSLRSRKSMRQYRTIVGWCSIPRCISFAIRKATRMESDIIDADYRTRAFSSLIMVRSISSGSRPVWEFPLEFFGTTGHNTRGLRLLCNKCFSVAFFGEKILVLLYIVLKYIAYFILY